MENEERVIMIKWGILFFMLFVVVVVLMVGFVGFVNVGVGDCCDQLEDLQCCIFFLEEKVGVGGFELKWKVVLQWS